jgi:hypothetical protein
MDKKATTKSQLTNSMQALAKTATRNNEGAINALSNKEVSSMDGFLSTALLEALELVMLNNHMRFGDIIVKQISRIAMGMSPAPAIANLYVAIYETAHILQYIPSVVLYLRPFIDDGFGVWLHDPDPAVDQRNWNEF